MTYTALAVAGVIAAVLLDVVVLRTRLVGRIEFWIAYAIIVFFQLITNGVLTGIPVVRYDPAQIIGWRVAFAPVEDLLFGFTLVATTLSIWVRLAPQHPPNPQEVPKPIHSDRSP